MEYNSQLPKPTLGYFFFVFWTRFRHLKYLPAVLRSKIFFSPHSRLVVSLLISKVSLHGGVVNAETGLIYLLEK